MNIWFTSDTHFGHSNIIKYCNRPFSSSDEMNERLIENWNASIKPGDSVYHLGDFSFMDFDSTKKFAVRLNGNKFLVKGNHDNMRNVLNLGAFQWVKDYFELRDGKRFIVLSHFPFLTWNKSHHGSWHLHGHTHGTLKKEDGICRYDVGVDCHEFSPISIDKIIDVMKKL